jgi:hypothetical protein
MKKTDISHTVTCFRIVGENCVQKLERVALFFSNSGTNENRIALHQSI